MAVKGEEIRQAKKFLENKKLSIKHMKPRLFAKVSEDLGKNLLSKGVDKIEEFKRIQGMSVGLNKAIEIIDETTQKYKEGDIDD